MNTERELLTRHLREMLDLVENQESDLSELRFWVRYWWWDQPSGQEIAAQLHRIERRLNSLEPSRCAFTENGKADQVVQFITGLEGRYREERKHITSWLHGTTELTIVEPYFFSFSGPNKIFRTQTQYVEYLFDLLPKTLERIEVFHLPGPNRKIFSSFQAFCRKKNISLRSWETTEIHDRVMIKNESDAIAIGTSFGGLGNKIAFILDIPEEDLALFRRELHRVRSTT